MPDVHVLNLSRPTSVDFSGVAKRLAEALVAPRSVEVFDNCNDQALGRFGEGPISDSMAESGIELNESALADVYPKPFTRDEVERLREAVRLTRKSNCG